MWYCQQKLLSGNNYIKNYIVSLQVDCTVETAKCRKWGVDSFPSLIMFQDGHKVSFNYVQLIIKLTDLIIV